MKFIYTTAAAAEKLDRIARQRCREAGASLAAALDEVARLNGYDGWKHVSDCLEQSPSARDALPALPESLVDYIAFEARESFVSKASLQAFQNGLAFAFDVKEVEGLSLDDDVEFCDDAWPIAAVDVLRGSCMPRMTTPTCRSWRSMREIRKRANSSSPPTMS